MIIHRRIEELAEPENTTDASKPRHALVPEPLPQGFDVLTPREAEVLLLLAQGHTRKRTAHVCGLSVHTVSDYAKHGYKKLGVSNRAQVAALLFGQSQA
ncbi:hypothetical protein C1J03_02800 [Sulfitobacter sp. SK012]|nr:hypothetical protein C1J03_02800 [Sulfitobacter sp. SK012]